MTALTSAAFLQPTLPAFDFAERSNEPEVMDAEITTFEEYRTCLADLAMVNRLTRTHAPTLAFFDRLLPRIRALGRPLEVVDVGSGYGDLLRLVDAWATKHGVEVSLTGVDLNPWSRRAAAEATPEGSRVRWMTADAFEYQPPNGIDVIVTSQFTHHLPDALVVKFLEWMESTARVGWFVNDLQRHAVPFHFFKTFAKLAGFHPVVVRDGLVSIARSFTVAEWEALLALAGVERRRVAIEWKVPFRLAVSRL